MFSLPVGAVSNIASILFSISGVISFWYSTAFKVSSSCFGLDAPVIAVDTSGLLITHAKLNCAMLIFISSANSWNFLNPYNVFSFFDSLKYLSKMCFKSWFLSNLLPSGIPLLYFPVNIPLANGDQTVVPSFL
jgi:hypothetical protein